MFRCLSFVLSSEPASEIICLEESEPVTKNQVNQLSKLPLYLISDVYAIFERELQKIILKPVLFSCSIFFQFEYACFCYRFKEEIKVNGLIFKIKNNQKNTLFFGQGSIS